MNDSKENVSGILGSEAAGQSSVPSIPSVEVAPLEAVPANEIPGEKVTLTVAELQALINTSKGDSMEKLGAILANALLESKKPYVDPRQQENEAAMRKAMRLQLEQQKRDLVATQELCPHLIGCNQLSEIPPCAPQLPA